MVDLEQELDQIIQSRNIEPKNPLLPPYSDRSKMTKTQDRIIDFVRRREGKRTNVAILGGKGSGKSHACIALALYWAQKYPESIGCVISNSHDQTNRIISQHIFNLAEIIGIKMEYFRQKKIRGRKYSSVFILDLDGRGFEEGINSYIFLHSFEAVGRLEGSELDWGYVEEIQDAEKDPFVVFQSRIRGTNADNSLFIAGMPDDEHHWMYRLLPKMGFDEDKYGRYDPESSSGVLFEPAVYENLHNLPDDYIDNIKASHDEQTARKYIEGERVSLNSNKVLHQYDDHLHSSGRMSEILCHYDPSKRIIISYDFNVSPLCMSVYQVKDWTDDWNDDEIFIGEDGIYKVELATGDMSDEPIAASLEEYAPPVRKVLAQIDEFEVWQGGTKEGTQRFIAKYEDHDQPILAMGDSSGKSKDTRGHKSDWDIIEDMLSGHFNHSTVVRGLVSRQVSGETRYDNPPKKDQINVANATLRDGFKRVHACLLPSSRYESGGTSRSVSMVKRKPDGRIDDSIDRSNDRTQPKTHFMDTFLYACYWFTDGQVLENVVVETPEQRLEREVKRELSRMRRTQKSESNGMFGVGRASAKKKFNF